MYVLMLAGEIADTPATAMANTLPSLEAAFARICCVSGLSYRFAPEDEGWRLEMTDVERPECSPASVRSIYKRLQDAQHDLMSQAVDGRVRGHVAISDDLFDRTRIMRNAQGARLHVG